ncbi:hypothetical protein RQP46_001553 [Phenoliferia psychrophenolica]
MSSNPFEYGIHAGVRGLVIATKAFSAFSKDVHSLDLIILRRGQPGAKPVLSTLTPPSLGRVTSYLLLPG